LIADLDGDGALETICRYHPNVQFPEQRLYCFNQRGVVEWIFMPGRPIRSAGREYFPPYYISAMLVTPPDKTGRRRIVLTNNHHWSFPDQVAVLDYRGRLVGEYWHHGHLPHLALLDLNSDGKLHLVVFGLNDGPGYKRATLLVFDLDHVSGSSLKTDGTPDFDSMAAGSEKTIVVFPKTRLSKTAEFNRVADVSAADSGAMAAHVSEGINEDSPYVVYEFARGLRPKDLTFSDSLRAAYRDRFGIASGDGLIAKDTEELLGEVIVAEGSAAAAEAVRKTSSSAR
jgi:hypothetical protein